MITRVLHLYISKGLQSVLITDTGEVQSPDVVVHFLGLCNDLICELVNLSWFKIPAQTVFRTDSVAVTKYHFT